MSSPKNRCLTYWTRQADLEEYPDTRKVEACHIMVDNLCISSVCLPYFFI